MASAEEELFEHENLVIISSNRKIDMTQWRKHLMEKENWEKVTFLMTCHWLVAILNFVNPHGAGRGLHPC